MTAAQSDPRATCRRCTRPVAMCVCADLPTVDTRTRVVVLQHPRERTHPFNTARLVGLALPQARVHVPYGGLSGSLHHPLELPDDAAVLYPHQQAVDLAALPATARPGTLVVLDGTWAHARQLYRQNPWLQRFRHVRLHPTEESRYRIRAEPQADYLSTVEAVVQALRILEPDHRGLADLLTAFDRMIDRQIAHVRAIGVHGRIKLPRNTPSRRLSPWFAEPSLVVAYAESSLPGGDVTAARELVQWLAARLDTGESLELVVRPPGARPSRCHLDHMGLDAADLDGGVDLATAAARFAVFAGPSPVVAAWTRSTLDWGAPLLPPGTRPLLLKIAYTNVRNRGAGFLEEVLQREGLQPATVVGRGRARERLGNALAVARWLRDLRARSAAEGPGFSLPDPACG